MKILILTVCSLLLWGGSGLGQAKDPERDARAIRFATSMPEWIVPTMANTGGRSGAFFKTRVVIHNHTSSSYFIHALLFGSEGFVDSTTIPLEPNASRIWDNFLGEVFDYSSNGAVAFYSFGLDDADQECSISSVPADPISSWFGDCDNSRFFSVTAEIYTDSPNGRYKTMVVNGVSGQASAPMVTTPDLLGILPIPISNSVPPPPANTGINVNEMERTNLGVFNFAGAARSIQAEVMDASGNLVEVVDFGRVPKWSWVQKAIVGPVENGVARWMVEEGGPVHLWAVVTDNRSNDGSYFPAIRRPEPGGAVTPFTPVPGIEPD